MAKKLVIAEKPSVGKDIGRVLKCTQTHNGYLEGKEYIVTWAMGHLVTLADPEKYDKKYATWSLESLPILFDKPKFSILKPTAKQYNVVNKLINRSDVKEIIIGTDAGREGELVARLILLKANNKKPIKRLWISSVTDRAIKDGFSNLKDGKEYYGLYMAALARSEADWILGINATRALTTKYNAKLSCGRVQTPTLQMIFEQDEKIKSFKSKEFYTASVVINNSNFTLANNNKKKSFNNLEEVNKLKSDLLNRQITISKINSVEKKSMAKPLYDLTTLQREANQMFGFSAKRTLDIIQGLYEFHKVVTYPRTDSKYLTSDMVPTLKERVVASDVFNISATKNINFSTINTKGFVNNQKVTDHHAIIPTEVKCNLSRLDIDEQKIYKLIVQRFLSVLLPIHTYYEKTITAINNSNEFILKGIEVKNNGWKAVYERQYDIDFEADLLDFEFNELNSFNLNEKFNISDVNIHTNFTKAPKAFTEGTLLAAMEDPSRYVDNENDKKVLRQTGGIGTVATRADIIDKLLNSQVIERNNNNTLNITNKGRQLLEVAPIKLKSPVLTAKWESDLKRIEQNKFKKDKFIKEIVDFTKTTIYDIKSNFYEFKHDNLTKQKCSKCGAFMLYGKSKNGLALTCSDPSCNHKEYVNIPRRNQCPTCMKKLEITGTTFEKSALTCSGCGYRKSVSAMFQEQGDTRSASKNEVRKLLKQQKKDNEIVNDNPFLNL